MKPPKSLIASIIALFAGGLLARKSGGLGNVNALMNRGVLANKTAADGRILAASSSLGRNATVAATGAKTGGRWASTQARKTFASPERREQLDTEFEMKTTEDVVATLGNLKGAMMKLGQMASYLDMGLPENVRANLAQLQADAPPMSAELAASVIREEFGFGPDELFAHWDPEPIASASIGQVHHARTKEGDDVAVKVQYPGVAEAIASDLKTNDALFAGLRIMFPGIDTATITEELRARLTEELDYELEAKNQAYFAEYFDRHPYIHVPKVFDDYSGGRVITSELVEGSTFAELIEWNQEERNLAAETIYRFTFGCIYRRAAFNGDPHPGNYIFHGGGKVTFLDFGLVKHFEPDDTALFESLILNMVVNPNMPAFRDDLEAGGLLPQGSDFSDELIEDYFSHFYDFVLEDRDFVFDADYAADGVKAIFETGGPHGDLKKALNVPASFVVLQRINLGLISLFAQLNATQNWRRIAEELWPFVNGGPSTETGHSIERWGRASGNRARFVGL